MSSASRSAAATALALAVGAAAFAIARGGREETAAAPRSAGIERPALPAQPVRLDLDEIRTRVRPVTPLRPEVDEPAREVAAPSASQTQAASPPVQRPDSGGSRPSRSDSEVTIVEE